MPQMAKYASNVNTLNERICLGCGEHMALRFGRGSGRAYCSSRCGMRVSRLGGRLTIREVWERIEDMLP